MRTISKTTAEAIAARSFKRLASVWPEGLPFYQRHLAQEARGTALATPFGALNATLGLPAAE